MQISWRRTFGASWRREVWSGETPGAAELAVNHKTVDAALSLLEHEGEPEGLLVG